MTIIKSKVIEIEIFVKPGVITDPGQQCFVTVIVTFALPIGHIYEWILDEKQRKA